MFWKTTYRIKIFNSHLLWRTNWNETSLRCMQQIITEKSKSANENFFLKMWFSSDKIALNENDDYCIAFEVLKKFISQQIDSWKRFLKQRTSNDWIFQKNFINVYMNFEKFYDVSFFQKYHFSWINFIFIFQFGFVLHFIHSNPFCSFHISFWAYILFSLWIYFLFYISFIMNFLRFMHHNFMNLESGFDENIKFFKMRHL